MLRANGLLAVLLFGLLTAVVALQVLNRLVLHLPQIWSEEVARFLFLWVVMLGAAVSVRRRRHFVLDVLPNRAPAATPLSFLLDVIPDLTTLGFALFLLVQGLGYARTGVLRTATNSGVNMALVFASIPVFAALTIVYAVMNLRAEYRAFRARTTLARPAPPAE